MHLHDEDLTMGLNWKHKRYVVYFKDKKKPFLATKLQKTPCTETTWERERGKETMFFFA